MYVSVQVYGALNCVSEKKIERDRGINIRKRERVVGEWSFKKYI